MSSRYRGVEAMQTWQCEDDQKQKCQKRAATHDAYTKPRMTARRFLEWIGMFESPGWSFRYEISDLSHLKTFSVDRLARLLSTDRLVYGQHYALRLYLGTANKGWVSKTCYSKASAKRVRPTTMIRDPVGIQTQDGSCEIISFFACIIFYSYRKIWDVGTVNLLDDTLRSDTYVHIQQQTQLTEKLMISLPLSKGFLYWGMPSFNTTFTSPGQKNMLHNEMVAESIQYRIM